jgi:N6-adenosine-specific RNA methylase IME4
VSHYDCLDFSVLAALPVADLAANNCALFLWVPDPMLPRAIELIKAWAFEYKTVAFHWVKLNSKAKHQADYFTGMGYWTRANPELCLLATRGKPARLAKDVRRLVVDRRREHSRKPDCVRQQIERLVAGPYLELFARESKPGWECWGDEAGLFDNGSVATRRQPSRLVEVRPDLVKKPPMGQAATLRTKFASPVHRREAPSETATRDDAARIIERWKAAIAPGRGPWGRPRPRLPNSLTS